jgi:hypothetical protein
MAMSRVDFEDIADVLYKVSEEWEVREVAWQLSELFKKKNPRFDSEKFLNRVRWGEL